jgi:hypothetical protein
MSRLASRLKAGAVTLGLLCAASNILDGRAFAAGHATSCATPEYREFDFWVGDWDVFETGSPTKVADARAKLHLFILISGCGGNTFGKAILTIRAVERHQKARSGTHKAYRSPAVRIADAESPVRPYRGRNGE